MVSPYVRKIRMNQQYSTIPSHMPERHQKQHQWTPTRFKSRAAALGQEVLQWVSYQFAAKRHPEQAYRICLGLLSLSREYPPERINTACAWANNHQLYRVKQVKQVLRSNLDQAQTQTEPQTALPQQHENIRGAAAFAYGDSQ